MERKLEELTSQLSVVDGAEIDLEDEFPAEVIFQVHVEEPGEPAIEEEEPVAPGPADMPSSKADMGDALFDIRVREPGVAQAYRRYVSLHVISACTSCCIHIGVFK